MRDKASFMVAKKLISFKAAFKDWVRKEKVKVEEGTNMLLEELEALDLEEGEGVLSREKGERREMIRVEVVNRIRMKERSLRQKARITTQNIFIVWPAIEE